MHTDTTDPKPKPESPFSSPKVDLTRDESVQVSPDESIIAVPFENNPIYANEESSRQAEAITLESLVLMVAFIGYVHFASVNSVKKEDSQEFQGSLAVTLFTNLHAFCGDELLHLVACLDRYEHRRPMAYWYRMYTIIGEGARVPLFYLYVQPELNRQMQSFHSKNEWPQNFMALMLGYMLLTSFSHLYSELINPKYMLSNTQKEIFFKWRSAAPDISPTSSPPSEKLDINDLNAGFYLPHHVLSTISETSEGPTLTPLAREKQEYFMRNGFNCTPGNTPSPGD